MSKIKELPYQQGYDARQAGQRTKANPYWETFEHGTEWAFHAWLHGWSDCNNEIALRELEPKENNGKRNG